MTTAAPDVILYAQHGWADDHRAIAVLANSLATPQTLVFAPSLGFLRTWIRIEPLIQDVEALVVKTSLLYPDLPIRIVGHSLGGLIWLEVLNRHPEWWDRVQSLVLVGSPVGGADLARFLDPLAWGLGMARDLGKNRRAMAEAIAAKIPTLVIAGDIDQGSDGTVTLECTKVFGADFVRLPGLRHATLKNHPAVAEAIQRFWAISEPKPYPTLDLVQLLIRQLQQIPGMTDAHYRGFMAAKVFITFKNGVTLRTWKNAIGVDHVFVVCPDGTCLYSGFVGWLHAAELRHTLNDMKREHAVY